MITVESTIHETVRRTVHGSYTIVMAGFKRPAEDAGARAAKKHKPDNAKAGIKSSYSGGGREYSKHRDGKKYDWKKGEKKRDGKTQNGVKPEIFHGMRPPACSSS